MVVSRSGIAKTMFPCRPNPCLDKAPSQPWHAFGGQGNMTAWHLRGSTQAAVTTGDPRWEDIRNQCSKLCFPVNSKLLGAFMASKRQRNQTSKFVRHNAKMKMRPHLITGLSPCKSFILFWSARGCPAEPNHGAIEAFQTFVRGHVDTTQLDQTTPAADHKTARVLNIKRA